LSSTVSRRRFLKITAGTFGAAAAAGASLWGGWQGASAADAAAQGVTTIPTFCEMCFWRCGGIGVVRDGKLWKFEGNPKDPQCMGRLCPRGTGAVGAHYDPHRLRQPLIRTSERGKEQWKTASWDEALAFVAERMNRIKAEHGPESVAPFNNGLRQRFFQPVLKSWGVTNIAGASYARCRGARDVGCLLTYGAGVGSPEPTDTKRTDCLVLIGSQLGANMHNSQVQEFAQAVERQASVIAVDPRFSVAAGKAGFWLPAKPGTDIALLLARAQLLITEGRYDKAFVEKHGHGFDKFAAEIEGCTPEWAAEQCNVPAELIRAAARELASHRPRAIIDPGRRVNWYGDDTQRSRAIALVNALLGDYARAGVTFVAQGAKVEPFALPPQPKSDRPHADGSGADESPFADEGIKTSICKATLSGKPHPIKGWFVYSSNLLQALPDERETIEAIRKLDLLVVCDTMPSEIAGWADVVLPDTTFLERHDELLTGYGRTGWIALRQPVVAPPHDQNPAWWIGKQLAEKLGLGSSMPFGELKEYLAQRVTAPGLSWEQLQKDGVIMAAHKPVTVEEGLELHFDTPSGKVEFWSDQLAAAGLGIGNGDYVKLKNQDGVASGRVRVEATQRIRKDTVYMVFGFGRSGTMPERAHLRGASAGALNTHYATDPIRARSTCPSSASTSSSTGCRRTRASSSSSAAAASPAR
jgi:thiosulfate reductase/polysulfide reductase chain A